ncbi:uncharacterized protein [Rutidosis leptorrhynchoides]|uniref:uncharacterized protein n=1 Tax=Rutidosis leptorrhynchoides TaxID=125765 RepID=UPI003A9963EB
MEDLSYPSLIADNSANLELPFDEAEIKAAIFDCGSTKAPTPDGFNMRFLKKYWELIKSDLISAIQWLYSGFGKLGNFRRVGEGLNILSKAATENGLFEGVEIGYNKIHLSHLQYADDTIFLGKWSRANAYSLQNLLKCFELASGLKVNFHKSCLYGIGVEVDEINHVAGRLGCKVASFPFTYLGLPIGKWWWRFLTETDSLWCNIIRSIYGPCGGLELGVEAIRSLKPCVWRDILMTCFGISELDIPFRDSFFKRVGDGSSTSFWDENWTGKGKLRDVFSRLHRLEFSKQVLVKDRIIWADSGPKFVGVWAREPSGRATGDLSVLSKIMEDYCFDRDTADKWSWTLSSNGNFSVKRLNSIITDQFYTGNHSSPETLLNNLVPKKIELFVWRAIRKRLPVRIELDKRGVDLNTVRCPLCDDDLETVEHSFIFCSKVMDIWNRIFSWWGFGPMSNLSINEILRGNGPTQMTLQGKKTWQAVGWVCAYLVWSNRNNVVFRGKGWNTPVKYK